MWAALGKVLNMAIVVALEWFANVTKHVRVRYWSRKGGLTETVMIAELAWLLVSETERQSMERDV